MYSDELFEEYLQKNVLLTGEVGELLGVSKQQVSNLVKQGKIKPFKYNANSSLFLKSTIDEYMAKKLSKNMYRKNEIIGEGNTFKTRKHFDSIKESHKNIQEVHLYLNSQEAIFDGYYCLEGHYQRDALLRLDAPTCVLKLDNDEEIWYDGFNCGYGGTGPNGSYRLLIELGVVDELASQVFKTSKLSFYKTHSEWEMVNRTTSISNKDYPVTDSNIYMYNDRLVLVQNRPEKHKLDTQYEEFIDKYSFFIPRPVEIAFLSREEALNTGHVIANCNYCGVYQIIIKDISGSELWLDYKLNENQSISKQQNLESILKKIGITIPENKETLSERIKNWLGIAPVVADRITYRKAEK